MKVCPKCSASHNKLGTFCSRKCANSRGTRSLETKQKQSISNKKYFLKLSETNKKAKIQHLADINPNIAGGPYTKIKLANCSYCTKRFWSNTEHTTKFNTTCSDECFMSIKRKNRAGSKTEYNGQIYDSGWEAELAKWMDVNNIEFVRPTKHIPWVDSNGKSRKYFPDFYIPKLNLYVDPKNKFCIADQIEKLNYVSSKINLIYGEVEYIKQHIQV